MKDPPPELRAAVDFDGVDILGGLADIRKKVLAREYANQFEFTTAVERLVSEVPSPLVGAASSNEHKIASGRDSHFVLKPALNAVFVFVRNVSLVSVSSDGISPPQIYEESEPTSTLAAVFPGTEPSEAPALASFVCRTGHGSKSLMFKLLSNCAPR